MCRIIHSKHVLNLRYRAPKPKNRKLIYILLDHPSVISKSCRNNGLDQTMPNVEPMVSYTRICSSFK